MATSLSPPSPPGAETGADQRALVDALRARDPQAFHALVEAHYPTMKRVARGYVDSDAVAEEVVQETWLAVVRGIERFGHRSSLHTWIYAILINKARTHGAREHRTLPFSSAGPPGERSATVDPDRFQSDEDAWPGHWATPPRPWQKPERKLLSLEIRERLREALNELPGRQRAVVALRDVEGLGAEDVCELLDLSAENQRVLLHRGRSRLRRSLEAYVQAA
jgi:RNA polymerase sigma-70 factor (ECF subfamily)